MIRTEPQGMELEPFCSQWLVNFLSCSSAAASVVENLSNLVVHVLLPLFSSLSAGYSS
uniref:Uncharacterized protein n=1 Tax=Brassica oleracea TaxID=3712 RepID=A0A3P6FLV6_BRAOL|nr:unnamed protein product [Brassica oleracea]